MERLRLGLVELGGWCSIVSCVPPGSSSADQVVTPPPASQEVTSSTNCAPADAHGSWARFEGTPCDWELRDEDDRLVLRRLDQPAGPTIRGPWPEPCRTRTCVFEGVWTTAGPLVMAIVPSDDSEMPSGVWLGHAQLEELRFIDLWEGAGESVVTDYTSVGPAHALAPFICDDSLVLLVVERLSAGDGQPPAASLLDRQGWIDRPAPPLHQAAGDLDRARCVAIELPIP